MPGPQRWCCLVLVGAWMGSLAGCGCQDRSLLGAEPADGSADILDAAPADHSGDTGLADAVDAGDAGSPECLSPRSCEQQRAEACVATTWTSKMILQAGFWNWSPAIAVDDQGVVHIGFRDSDAGLVRYAHRPPAGAWAVEDVEPAGSWMENVGLALDPSGGVHLSYNVPAGSSSFALRHAYRLPGGGWVAETVAPGGSSGAPLAIDGCGGLHLAWTEFQVFHAYRPPGGAWTITPRSASMADSPSLALDPSGGVHLSYYDSTLVHAFRSPGGEWSAETVDTLPETEGGTSMAVDPSGGLHVAYCGEATRALNYASRSPGDTWAVRALDTAAYHGASASLAVDACGDVNVAYLNVSHEDSTVKYARRASDGDWQVETIDGLTSGQFVGLTVDTHGGVHVAYWDTAGGLHYAYRCP
jgi:hypothetical protein